MNYGNDFPKKQCKKTKQKGLYTKRNSLELFLGYQFSLILFLNIPATLWDFSYLIL